MNEPTNDSTKNSPNSDTSADGSLLPILNCDDCGACCQAIGHPQFYRNANDAIWQAVPDDLKAEVNEYVDSLTDIDLGQPCIWLDQEKKQCRHYEYRPQMCRDFEVGSVHCRRLRSSLGVNSN